MPPFRDTSFTQTTDENPVDKRVEPHDPFLVLGIIFLIIAVFASALSYGYNFYLQNKNRLLKDEIDKVNSSLQQYPLRDMLGFYNQVKLIETLTATRNRVSTVFYIIESTAQKNIYFKKFAIADADKGRYTLTLVGVSPDYKSIARQMDSLKDEKYSKIFKTVKLKKIEQSGEANLSFEIVVDVMSNLPISSLATPVVDTSTPQALSPQETSVVIEEPISTSTPVVETGPALN